MPAKRKGWPLHAGYADTIRLLPLLPFLDAIRRNFVDVMYLAKVGLGVKEIAITIPDFIFSTVVLAIGLSMFLIRWQTVSGGALLFSGILLQMTAELKEYHAPEFPLWDYFTLFLLVVTCVSIGSSLLSYKPDRDIKVVQWCLIAILLAALLLFIGHEEHYYLAWHLPMYLTLISFAHLASMPQWVAYDAEVRTISINARRQRGRILMFCLSLLVIPAGLLYILSNNDLPSEITFYRVLPLLFLPMGAIYYQNMPVVCMLGFIGWTADLLNRILHQDISVQMASENIAVISAFLISLDYSVQAEALLPT